MTGGEIKHFLSINNLSIGVINSILDRADSFFPIGSKSVKKIPILGGKQSPIYFLNRVPAQKPLLN